MTDLEKIEDQLNLALNEIKTTLTVEQGELIHDYVFEAQRLVKKLNIDDFSNQREFLLTFAQEWNWANDIADSPVIPNGFVDDFLNQIKDENTTIRRRD